MIGRLRGKILEIEGAMLTVDTGGVGYEVLLPESVLAQLSGEEEVDLRIRQVFREDGVTLYGFLEPFQRRLFDLLLSVKGCGPKIGLALIGQLGENTVAGAIVAQDARSLSRASGVGARLAERIILELKDKMQEEQFQRKVAEVTHRTAAARVPEDDVIDALVALGYRRQEAENAAKEVEDQAEKTPDRIRLALKVLAK